jgi:hypothetical protein
MTDQELKDLVAGLAVAQDRTDQDLKDFVAQATKNDQKIAASSLATDAKIDKMQAAVASIGKQLGNIGENQGSVAEEFFYNSLSDKPTVGGIAFDRVIRNVGAGKPGNQVEFDIVMHNGVAMAIVGVKYKVHPNSLDQIEKQMRRYRELFPEYKNHKLYGGLAGFSVPDDVIQQAHERATKSTASCLFARGRVGFDRTVLLLAAMAIRNAHELLLDDEHAHATPTLLFATTPASLQAPTPWRHQQDSYHLQLIHGYDASVAHPLRNSADSHPTYAPAQPNLCAHKYAAFADASPPAQQQQKSHTPLGHQTRS